MRNYSIEADTISAMMAYCNLTPGIVQEITTAMSTLISTFESESSNLVHDHLEDYRDLLAEFKSLMNMIAGDIDSSSTETRRKALLYQQVLSKKIR